MLKISVKNGKVDDAMRVLRQKNAKDGLLKEVRKREHYSKPGEKRREARKEAIKNSRRRERNNRAA